MPPTKKRLSLDESSVRDITFVVSQPEARAAGLAAPALASPTPSLLASPTPSLLASPTPSLAAPSLAAPALAAPSVALPLR